MRTIFDGETTNTTSGVKTRGNRGLGTFMVQGKLKWKETGGGTATVTWTDAFTGETVDTANVTANGGGSGPKVDIPWSYELSISGVAGGAEVTVGIDGDTGK